LRVAELCAVFLRKAFTFQTVLDMGEDLGEEAANDEATRWCGEGALDDATLHDASNIDVLCRALQLPLPHEVFDAGELESVARDRAHECRRRCAQRGGQSARAYWAGSLGASALLVRAAKRSQAILEHTQAEYKALREPRGRRVRGGHDSRSRASTSRCRAWRARSARRRRRLSSCARC
jgi:hypothetical protein